MPGEPLGPAPPPSFEMSSLLCIPQQDWCIAEAHTRIAAQQRAEDDLELDPRQGRAKTVVDASSEGDVLLERPLDVDSIRIDKHAGIAVRCAEREMDSLSSGDRPFADRYVLDSAPSCSGARSARSRRRMPGSAVRAAYRSRRRTVHPPGSFSHSSRSSRRHSVDAERPTAGSGSNHDLATSRRACQATAAGSSGGVAAPAGGAASQESKSADQECRAV
jgi:hypothetical protein